MALTPSYKIRGPVGVVIAHPDDESMFFIPALSALQRNGQRILILSLSSGNIDGLGETRKRELFKACSIFGVGEDDVHVIEHSKLQDGSITPWPSELVASYVRDFVQENDINTLLTFDDHGISGHSDHAAVSRGVGLYLRIRANSSSNSNRPLDAFVLASTGILRKYSGLMDVPWSWVTARRPPLGAFFVNFNPKIAWRAMAAHRSQFVWYRRLFVIFSRYAYVNTFERMHVPPRG